MFTQALHECIDRSVLCWLATATTTGLPNVSPKEVFVADGDSTLLIANIASPQSAANIHQNPAVSVAMIDILVQKGFQLYGSAQVIAEADADFFELSKPLLEITKGNFPFASLFKISVSRTKPIIAPRYLLYPETTEADQIADAKRTYGF